MNEIKAFLTATSGIGVLFAFLFTVIKYLFPKALETLTKSERWIIFLLCFGLCVFCLVHGTQTVDGGNQQDQKTGTENPSKKTSADSSSTSFIFSNSHVYAGNIAANNNTSECGVDLKDYIIYESFNNDKPYFINPGNTTLRLVLVSLDQDQNKAQVEVNDNGNPISGAKKLLITFPYVNASSTFRYGSCRFKITYLGFDSFNAGIKYLLRTRYYAKVRLEMAQ
jgi:hypothetical protein